MQLMHLEDEGEPQTWLDSPNFSSCRSDGSEKECVFNEVTKKTKYIDTEWLRQRMMETLIMARAIAKKLYVTCVTPKTNKKR